MPRRGSQGTAATPGPAASLVHCLLEIRCFAAWLAPSAAVCGTCDQASSGGRTGSSGPGFRVIPRRLIQTGVQAAPPVFPEEGINWQ